MQNVKDKLFHEQEIVVYSFITYHLIIRLRQFNNQFPAPTNFCPINPATYMDSKSTSNCYLYIY